MYLKELYTAEYEVWYQLKSQQNSSIEQQGYDYQGQIAVVVSLVFGQPVCQSPKFSQPAKIQHILVGVGHKDVIKILGSSAAFSSWSNRSLFSTVTEMEKTEDDQTEKNNY